MTDDELARAQAAVEAARNAQAEAEAALAAIQASQTADPAEDAPDAAAAKSAESALAESDSADNAESSSAASQDAALPADSASGPSATEPIEDDESAAAQAAVAPPTGPLDEQNVESVRAGYAFEGTALEMGALVNGEVRPDVPVRIPLAMVNRHGLVAGATGTGKTKTLQVLAEQLSTNGVPVFAADIKGDLSGIASPGEANDKLLARTKGIGQDWAPHAAPVEYFALGGVGTGVPIRATITSFGPILLSKVLGLNNTQESSLGLVFAYADQQELPLLDLKDLREVLLYLTGPEGKAELRELGGVSPQTAGVILRELTAFSEQGADVFFGEPEIDVKEFLRVTPDGLGLVSLLEVPGVQDRPALFSTFLMYLLAELFEELPEVGDIDKPKLVFFFDEAHLLFKDASKDFLAAITQTVRLIRSKGVGIFFVTQTPKDVPADVLAQLGSRVQHQLRAHTPDDESALRSTVRTYPKSGYELQEVLTSLGIGEAVVTVMNERGAPTPVAWTRLRAPQGSMDPTPADQMQATVAASRLTATYATALDRESAYEILSAKLAKVEAARREAELREQTEKDEASRRKTEEAARREAQRQERARTRSRGSGSGNVIVDMIGSRTGQTVIREIVRGIFGTRRR